MTKAVALNNAVDYCDPTANSCTFSQTWPSLTFAVSGADLLVTDALGQTTRYVGGANGGQITGVRRPSSPSANNISYTWAYRPINPDVQVVVSVSDGGGTWTYSYKNPPPPPQMDLEHVTTIVDPLNHSTVVTSTRIDDVIVPHTPYPIWRVTAVSGTTGPIAYSYNIPTGTGPTNGQYMLSSVTYPEGNSVRINYDARGNITQIRNRPKGGAANGSDDLVTQASYAASCTSGTLRTCNQPLTITDPRQNTWTFTYDAAHGGVVTMTEPQVQVDSTGSLIAPQTRYFYEQFNAGVRNSSGSIVQVAAPVWRQTRTERCPTSTNSCNGTASEVESVASYEQGGSGVRSNILPLTATTRAGNSSLSATVTTAWSDAGDPLSVDGPRTDVSDITHYRYDAMRQRVGEIAAPVTVGGSTRRPATRTDFNEDGLIVNVERGTVPETLNPTTWDASFITLENTLSAYNAQARKVRDTYHIGGVAQRVTQYSYDARGSHLLGRAHEPG